MSVWPPAISPWLAWLALGVAAILVCLAIDVGPVQDLLYYGLGFVSAGLVVAGELKLDRSVIVGVGTSAWSEPWRSLARHLVCAWWRRVWKTRPS